MTAENASVHGSSHVYGFALGVYSEFLTKSADAANQCGVPDDAQFAGVGG